MRAGIELFLELGIEAIAEQILGNRQPLLDGARRTAGNRSTVS